MGTMPGPPPYHRPITRRTERGTIARHIHRGLPLILVVLFLISRGSYWTNRASLDPVAQLAQQEYSDAAQNDGRNRSPDHSVHELVELRIRHTKDDSNFAA
jgi:hypothetical protein